MARLKGVLSLVQIVFVAFFATAAHSYHAHPRKAHVHNHVRQALSPSTTLTMPLPSFTAGNAILTDIEEVQEGLSSLPQDVLNVIIAIEQRLQQAEAELASLLSNSLITSSATPAASSTSTLYRQSSTPPGPGISSSSPVTVSNTVSLRLTPLTAEPTTRHITDTLTRTSKFTVTHYVSIPLESSTNYTIAYGSSTMNVKPTTVTASAVLASTQVLASTFISYSVQPSPSPYLFRADSQANVAVYYRQTPNTTAGGLLALCESPDVDIVNLAFVNDFFSRQGYPSINFGPACDSPTAAQAEAAPGLLNCAGLAPEIAACQEIGKKVLVSLGGYLANTSFVSSNQAVKFAETLWNLFGAGTSGNIDLRPFGPNVVVDGFDIDTEQKNPAHYDTFASALRQQYAQDTSKIYYISAAPQCPIPDASIPVGAMMQADFVWVQFYNNPSCNLGSAGFQDSFAAWSQILTNSSTPGTPRLYIGIPAFAGAGSGYVVGDGLETLISQARELTTKNLGGIMLWDGSEGVENVDQYGDNYLMYAKSALQ